MNREDLMDVFRAIKILRKIKKVEGLRQSISSLRDMVRYNTKDIYKEERGYLYIGNVDYCSAYFIPDYHKESVLEAIRKIDSNCLRSKDRYILNNGKYYDKDEYFEYYNKIFNKREYYLDKNGKLINLSKAFRIKDSDEKQFCELDCEWIDMREVEKELSKEFGYCSASLTIKPSSNYRIVDADALYSLIKYKGKRLICNPTDYRYSFTIPLNAINYFTVDINFKQFFDVIKNNIKELIEAGWATVNNIDQLSFVVKKYNFNSSNVNRIISSKIKDNNYDFNYLELSKLVEFVKELQNI